MSKPKVYTFRCEEELIKQLDAIAFMLGISRSEALREAIALFIKTHPPVKIKNNIKVTRVVLK